MKINNYIIFSLIFVLLSSCIERYFLDENNRIVHHIVIDGLITDGCDMQEITVSNSSSSERATFIPVSNCMVSVVDENNNLFDFVEEPQRLGHYFSTIDDRFLYIGNKFKMRVVTPDGEEYESPFEEMLPCPPIDSLYYEISQQATADPDVNIDGLQFYIDFEASDYFGPYYRLILEETYEYHSTWPKKNYVSYFGRTVYSPIDYSDFICYGTYTVNEILTLSTKSLTENRFKHWDIMFVDNLTQRLLYNYSLLVKQRSLNESAYNYWENLRKNAKENSGLFTKQPIIVNGNIRNLKDTTAVVLGYFSVSSETSQRIVIADIWEPSFFKIDYCTPIPKDITWPMDPRPLYILEMNWGGNEHHPAWAPTECFDCTLYGGGHEKPSFFD